MSLLECQTETLIPLGVMAALCVWFGWQAISANSDKIDALLKKWAEAIQKITKDSK